MPAQCEPVHRILLTFDDGPHPAHTVSVLDELARHKFSAIFFVLGANLGVSGNRAILERAAREGHWIGNHGYSQQNLTNLTDDEIRSGFRRTEVLIGDQDRGVKLWRPPFGERNPRVEAILSSLGYSRMLWNVDSLDWQEDTPSTEWIGHTLNKIRVRRSLGFRNTVCLFHDSLGSTSSQLRDLLERISELPDTRIARYNPCDSEGLSLAEDPARPSDAVSFRLGDSRVMARPNRSALYILNHSASLIWDALADGASAPVAAQSLMLAYGIPEDVALRDVQAALADWRTRGLLGPKAPEMEDPGPWPLSTDEICVPSVSDFTVQRSYRFLDLLFHIRFQTNELANAIHPRFANLETVESAPGGRVFEAITLSAGFALRPPNAPATRHESIAALAYRLFFAVMRLAHPGLDLMACLHSSLASYGQGTLALVGNNGSGKSTLVAALANSGMSILSDDRLFLDFATHQPAATPNAIGLKRGSWSPLQSRYPDLLELPVVRVDEEEDEEEVRFLQTGPPSRRLLPPVTHIFFPRFGRNTATVVTPLTSIQALERIAAAEGWISSQPEKLEAFLQWIDRLRCYELPFSNLNAAIERIGECLSA
jgi:peptidoglycan/xylan/chitin deacetylase (PgdA/CDA1 family)